MENYSKEILKELAFEFPHSNEKEFEERINKRLKRKKLGTYDQKKVDKLRSLKNDLMEELSDPENSEFYHNSGGEYAEMGDWDVRNLAQRMMGKYTGLPASVIKDFIPYAIYLYYLR